MFFCQWCYLHSINTINSLNILLTLCIILYKKTVRIRSTGIVWFIFANNRRLLLSCCFVWLSGRFCSYLSKVRSAAKPLWNNWRQHNAAVPAGGSSWTWKRMVQKWFTVESGHKFTGPTDAAGQWKSSYHWPCAEWPRRVWMSSVQQSWRRHDTWKTHCAALVSVFVFIFVVSYIYSFLDFVLNY